MRGNRVMLVDYSFIRFDVRFVWICYGREKEKCLPTSSTAVTDRKGLDVRSNPEAQDSAALAALGNERFSGRTNRSVALLFPRVTRSSEISVVLGKLLLSWVGTGDRERLRAIR